MPIPHLNGYKIANPTVLPRLGRGELSELLRGNGYEPHFVEGDDPERVHPLLAGTLDQALAKILSIQNEARSAAGGNRVRPRWPMIVLQTPKGWTGPKPVDGKATEDHCSSHQVPIAQIHTPTAACCYSLFHYPIFATSRSPSRSPGRRTLRPPDSSASFCAMSWN